MGRVWAGRDAQLGAERDTWASRRRAGEQPAGPRAETQVRRYDRPTVNVSSLLFLKQLALCFSQWMELSNQPQISSTVLDLCYSIFNSMHTNEESQIAAAKFTKKDSHETLGRPFFLFRPRNGRTIEGSEYHGI
ncbi:neuromedin-S isoform 4-T4 [Morphnus guianensis]